MEPGEDHIRQGGEEHIDHRGQHLRAARPVGHQPFRQVGEAGDVEEETGRRKTAGAFAAGRTLQDELGHERADARRYGRRVRV